MSTHKYIANCVLCVPESQAADYERAHPELPQLVHPDSVVGLWAKREWVRLHADDHIQVDDDGIGFYRIYRGLGGWKKAVLGPQRAYELIQGTAERCRAHGAFYFGFAPHVHPLTYNGLHPFRYGGYNGGGQTGILKGWKGFWPTDVTYSDGDDHWACLINYHFHRYAFFDRRFSHATRDTFTGGGGLNEFRAGVDDKDEMLEYLQRHFGREVIVRNYDDVDGVATKYAKNRARRRLVLPYRA